MENIDLFNRYTAQVLSVLYKSFPIPLSLNHETLAETTLGPGAWEPDISSRVADGNDNAMQRTPAFHNEAKIVWYTICWLRDCDYIRTDDEIDRDRRRPASYVLSPKGFEVLSMVPDSLDATISYGEKLAEVAEKASGEAGKAAISEIVGTVIGAAWRASGWGGA